VAKGWAADLAVRRLSAHGAALIDAGGDIAVHGEWPIGVADPFEPDRDLAVLRIRDRGVATSGRDLRRWMRGGAWQHHLIDPRTGLPATTDVLRVTITAPTAQEAEAAAKAVLILGRREGLKWLKRRPGLGALLVLEDREIVTNQRMEVLRWM
jgi:thiamine biosynthesis lipoprotein